MRPAVHRIVEGFHEKGYPMRHSVLFLLVLAIFALPAASPAAQAPTSETEKTLYTLGFAISQNLSVFGLSEAELDLVKAGLSDGVMGKPAQVDLRTYGPKLQEFQRSRSATAAAQEKKAGQAVLAKAAGEKGATKTPAGAVVIPLRPGTGASPSATDKVKVHYHGTLRDGTVFDSSVDRGQPATFALNQVVPGWTEGLQLMPTGSQYKLYVPSKLAYGERGPGPIGPNATLIFDVKLISIEPPAAEAKPGEAKPGMPPKIVPGSKPADHPAKKD